MPMMMSQVLKSVNFAKGQKFTYHENEILFILQIEKICITKPCTHLHSAHFSLHPDNYFISNISEIGPTKFLKIDVTKELIFE